ncbi:hypothetical protein L195_g048072, partial [Trifolium pratense]
SAENSTSSEDFLLLSTVASESKSFRVKSLPELPCF